MSGCEALMTERMGRAYGSGPVPPADPLAGPAQLYRRGFRDGLAVSAQKVRQAEWEASRLYILAFTQKDRQAFLLDRLDAALDATVRGDVDALLDRAWQNYLAGLDNVMTTSQTERRAA